MLLCQQRSVESKLWFIVMYGCDSWTIKKAEHQRIDAFELWYWRRLLGVPWTARRSNQSILKEISPEYSLERLMLKLKLQYFGHLIRRADSLEKTLILGKIEGRSRRGWTEELGRLQSMGVQRVRYDWTYTWEVSLQFSSVAQSCPTLCHPMNRSTPGFPVHHQLPESTQTHVHWVGDAIQPSHPLSSLSPPAFNLSQHQGVFKWVSSLHQVAKVLEFQLQHQSFQWIFRTDFL